MNKKDKILLDKELPPEVKVYQIGRLLHEENAINPQLWYAILEMKDQHHAEFNWNM